MPIRYDTREQIAYVTITNPGKANMLDRETADQLSAAWNSAWEDREVRAVIITGEGDRHFCAGHNLTPPPGVSADEREFLRLRRLFWPNSGTVNGSPTGVDGRMGDHYPRIWKPVIAAVNGWAAGAGLYILLACTDIRIACSEHAQFKFALLSQGWLGQGPGATLLARQLRYVDAMRILLTDEPVGAEEAHRIGLVNEVVPHDQLLARAEEVARRIVSMPPVAVRMMKEFAIRYRDVPEDQAWHVQTLINNLLIQATDDGSEGRRAFNEKREPNFTGGLRRPGDAFEEPTADEWERLDRLSHEGF